MSRRYDKYVRESISGRIILALKIGAGDEARTRNFQLGKLGKLMRYRCRVTKKVLDGNNVSTLLKKSGCISVTKLMQTRVVSGRPTVSFAK